MTRRAPLQRLAGIAARLARAFVVVAAGVLHALPLKAQVFQVQGGGSSLIEGYGGVLNVWGNGYEGTLGIGYLDGLRLSASARRLLGRDTLRLGNDILPLELETDFFGYGNAMMVQGAGIQGRRGRTAIRAFAGASASALASTLFSASRSERPLGLLSIERPMTERLTLSGVAIGTRRQSIFGSARWQPTQGITGVLTGGIGSNVPYGAAGVDARSSRFDVKALYAQAGHGFRRAAVPLPYQSEVERENVLATWRLSPDASVSIGRQHFRQDSALAGTAQRASLDQIFANGRYFGTALAGGLFDSRSGGVHNVSSYLSARRDLRSWLQTDLHLLRVWAPRPARATTPVLHVREILSPRLSLLQVFTLSGGRTSASLGGSFSSGLSSISVDYQVVHSPYRTADPFVQAIALNARVQLGSYQLSVGSFVTPDGRVHYSASGSTFFYRGEVRGGPVGESIRFDRYLVHGRVVDDSGSAIEGAAIEIGGEVIFTDSQGRFFQRRSLARALTLRVLPEDFLVHGRFEVVSAPAQVTPQREERSVPLVIVLRRLNPPPTQRQ
jgi:hypothetical protein